MALLQYDFKVLGERSVHAAFASIERRATQHNAFVARTFGGTSTRASAAGSRMQADAHVKARLANEKELAAAGKALDKQRSAALRANFLAEERARMASERRVQQEARRLDRERASAATALDRQRSRAVAAQFRAAERDAMGRRRERQSFTRGMMATTGRSVGGTLGAVGTMAGSALGIAGVFAAGSAIQTRVSESAKAADLANSAGDPSLKGALLRESQGLRGFTGMEALEGLEAFVQKTGDLEAARALMGDLSQLALATGSNLGEMAAMAGQAFNVLEKEITDPKELLKEVSNLMPVFAQQGRLGTVEVRDLATEFSKLGAAAQAFEGGKVGLLRGMGAFAQMAMDTGGASTSSDAATAAARLAGDIVTNRKKFKTLDVDIQSKTDKTKLRRPEEIMADVLEKTGGDVMKTAGLFGMESKKIFTAMGATFSEHEKRKPGTGRAEALKEFNRLAGADISKEDIAAQAQSVLDEPGMKLKETQKKFNDAVGEKLLPVLIDLIPKFTELIPSIAKAAEFFAKLVDSAARDPVGALFKVLAAKLALDLASAGIGNAIKNKLVSLVGGAGGGVAVPAGVGGAAPAAGGFLGKPTAAGALGAAGIGLGVGTLVAAGIEAGGVASFEAGETNMETAGQLQVRAKELGKAGKFAEQDDLIKQLHEMSRKSKDRGVFDSFMGVFGASNKDVEQRAIEGMAAQAEADRRQMQLEAQQAAGQQLMNDTKAAGEAFKVAVADAGKKLPANRGNTPTAPVP